MAQHTQIILVDDLDGSSADESITFALDGITYEIDLSEENAAALRDDFAKWIGCGRRQGGRRQTSTSSRPARKSGARADLNEVRAWGRANGFQVSDRGRVSAALQEAYDKAN